ncbi:MAG: SAM-dependent methyltransferase [Acetobacteraceae bacterium]|nr:SAM-dependent methyltransferase [Acetobacteraceae bacterium]
MERLDHFMARANTEYYAAHDPYGDFTTAPEISQVFGELLGLWAAVVWQGMGAPDPVLLVECGPGRGTLMADALRAIRRMAPDFAAALRVHLVETSPRLRAVQAAAVPKAVFHDRVEALPDGPMVLLANEFLDALPIRQFVRQEDGWVERYVAKGTFTLGRIQSAMCAHVKRWRTKSPLRDGDVVEVGEVATDLVAKLAARIAAQGGAALFIDYGPEHSAPGDSLQALRGGINADPLANPGMSDLTAHVDFEALAHAAAGATVHGPLAQGLFLTRLGLFQRTGVLARTLPPARGAAMLDTARRLAEPDQMGRLFKVLCISHSALPEPPGFTA